MILSDSRPKKLWRRRLRPQPSKYSSADRNALFRVGFRVQALPLVAEVRCGARRRFRIRLDRLSHLNV